ncbi:histidine phosphatase family protein [Pseudomonas sp. REP124]|uniref:lipopolysaccharide core heptose(II)-phosphate phosphatase PmrG n=1 Tax=Pseudomonas sp. REP124 TaxID=2875731 RepID=UPI001CCEEF0A|nr:histidine phosphatase family protein [Pseudomonas sp. REP124]MBZ9783322.1 histidine phosphatase family protein [Pseudomonas sp. REP124]
MPARRLVVELRLFGITRTFDLSRLARYRNSAVILACALLVIPLTVFLLRPAAVPDLAHGNVAGARALQEGWAKGDVIVLVRHVERCDRSRSPCLSSGDGITDRSRDVAVTVGAQFERLGLGKADIYNSPLLRTAQTAGYMFNKVDTGDDWLINCKGTMLRDALAHKVAGRNLILVTHSECMTQLEKDLKVPGSTLGYGASLFITADPFKAPRMLGFIEASDWRSVADQ